MCDAVFPAAELACRDFEERAAGMFGCELWVGLGYCNMLKREGEEMLTCGERLARARSTM